FSEDRGIRREAGLPECVRKDGDVIIARDFFVRQERSALLKWNLEGLEQGGGYGHDFDAFRGAACGEIAVARIMEGDKTYEGMACRPPRLVPAVGQHVPVRVVLAHDQVCVHQPLGIGKGQRAPELRFEDAKDGRVGADAEGQSKDDDGSEAGRFPQYAQTNAQILNEVLNPIYTSRVAASLFGLLDTAQVKSRAAVRLFLRHPLRHVFLDFSFEVVAQLVVQFLIRLRPTKQRP